MPSYTVHLPPGAASDADVAESSQFVKDGFATYGFLFTVFWLIAQRLWLHALGYVALLAFALACFWIFRWPFGAFGLVQALLAILIGLEGHEWVRRSLARRGWTQVAAISGPTLDEAERRFFEGWLADRPAPPAPRATQPPPAAGSPAPRAAGVLGLFPQPPRGGA